MTDTNNLSAKRMTAATKDAPQSWEKELEDALVYEWQRQLIDRGMKIQQAKIHAQARLGVSKSHWHTEFYGPKP